VNLEVVEKIDDKKFVSISTIGTNQHGKVVVKGKALVLPSAQKLSIPRPELPVVTLASSGCDDGSS
jgi:hypothetical protein